jgi:CTP synthase
VTLRTVWINVKDDQKVADLQHELKDVDGILIPGGFGKSGIKGKLNVITYAREHNIPLFGICLGMQLITIEYAQNVLLLDDAGSYEFGNHTHNVIDIMRQWDKDGSAQQADQAHLGGTMRLGSYPCELKPGSKAHTIYGKDLIHERHRHRYEFNTSYKDTLESRGLVFSGYSPDKLLMEIVEVDTHPWLIGVQFHPELKSRPFSPHPLFTSFIESAKKYKERSRS